MISKEELEEARKRTIEYLERAKILITKREEEKIEVADFGLSDLKHFGLEIVVYVNTEKYCAKELVLFPRQICVEHRHPPFDNSPGKQETFRCRWGQSISLCCWAEIPFPAVHNSRGKEEMFYGLARDNS